MEPLFKDRLEHSEARLRRLTDGLADAAALRDYAGLTVFAAGSYGRGEASEHSDIDLFLLHNEQTGVAADPNLRGIRVLSAIIRLLEEGDGFPLPSNDGQFFKIIKVRTYLKISARETITKIFSPHECCCSWRANLSMVISNMIGR